MYIRRKVYSAVEDYDGEIRYFSTNEIISEDDYLEALYSEDYLDDDDMERLYSDKEEKEYRKGLSTGAKIAIGAAGAAAAGVGLHYAGAHAAKKAAKGWDMNKLERGLAKVNQGEKWVAGKFSKNVIAPAQTRKAIKTTGFGGDVAADVKKAIEAGDYKLARKLANTADKPEKLLKSIEKAEAKKAAAFAKEKSKVAKGLDKKKEALKKLRAQREGKTYESYAEMKRLAEKGYSDYED